MIRHSRRTITKGQVIKVAIAHGEGNYEADAETIKRLEGEGRVAFRYCDARGVVGGGANPNGSVNDIAGIYSENFRVLGLMPHPENLIDPLVGGTDGRGLFESVARLYKTRLEVASSGFGEDSLHLLGDPRDNAYATETHKSP